MGPSRAKPRMGPVGGRSGGDGGRRLLRDGAMCCGVGACAGGADGRVAAGVRAREGGCGSAKCKT